MNSKSLVLVAAASIFASGCAIQPKAAPLLPQRQWRLLQRLLQRLLPPLLRHRRPTSRRTSAESCDRNRRRFD